MKTWMCLVETNISAYKCLRIRDLVNRIIENLDCV